MPQPVIVQEPTLRQFAHALGGVFSRPQWKYLVTVLLGLLHCDAHHTLSGLLRQVAATVTVSGLSRFLKQAPWSVPALTAARQRRFEEQLAPAIAQAHVQQRQQQAGQRGRPPRTVVTGYLIADDSPHVKPYAQAMEGQGWHYVHSDQQQRPGHSLFQCLYCLLGRQLPLTPQLYRQRVVCEREGVPFQSKVDLLAQTIETFAPPPDTHTHLLIDAWYTNRRIWRAAWRRGWDITGGLKSNRQVRVVAADGQRRWLRLSDYTATFSANDFQAVVWPNQAGGQVVYGHLLRTRVKKLGACQVLIVKPTADALLSQARYWATSRLRDSLAEVVATVAVRWTVEVFFADFKELLGSDQYQVRSAQAIVRFWALAVCLYQYLDEQRWRLQQEQGQPVTLGQARTWVRERHRVRLLAWLGEQFAQGASVQDVHSWLQPAVT